MPDFPFHLKLLFKTSLLLVKNITCPSINLHVNKFYRMKALCSFHLIGLTALSFSCSKAPTENISQNNMDLPKSLKELKLFKGSMAELTPADNVQVLELSSTLFTDYSEKQRLVKLPEGKKMKAKNDNLPEFSEKTILAKTFYYSAAQTGGKKKIIETRVLIKNENKWNVATYIWNEQQTEAFLCFDGASVPVNIVDPQGQKREINYKVPTGKDCVDCHGNFKELTPIGPKLRNLNINIMVNGNKISQLQHLKDKGLLEIKEHASISVLPSYKDSNQPLEKRARAYFEMNCAHCHNPSGFARPYGLNLRYETDFEDTGIYSNKWNIAHRMKIHDMPKLGTTVVDKEGLKLITQYIATLK